MFKQKPVRWSLTAASWRAEASLPSIPSLSPLGPHLYTSLPVNPHLRNFGRETGAHLSLCLFLLRIQWELSSQTFPTFFLTDAARLFYWWDSLVVFVWPASQSVKEEMMGFRKSFSFWQLKCYGYYIVLKESASAIHNWSKASLF